MHLIQITDQKSFNQAVQVFTIAKSMMPSKATEQMVSNKANQFASANNTAVNFDNAAKTISKKDAGQIKHNDVNINGINGSARDMIKNWLYNTDTKVGSVSSAYLIDNKTYVVAKLTSIAEKGQPDLDQFKNMIENEIKKEKRTEIITKDIAFKIAGKADIVAVAAAIGDTVHRAKDIKFGQPFLPIGYEPKLVGAVFGAKANAISKPIAGNAGVFVFIAENVTPATAPTDLNQSKVQLEGMYNNGLEYGLFNSIKKRLNIKDNRSDFF